MEKKLRLLFFFYLIFQTSFSQEKRVEINGVVLNPSSKALENSHILNVTTNTGTISNTDGTFVISAKKGDWIQVTNIQFHSKKIKIAQNSSKERFLRVYLLPILNQLDEVKLKKRMTGFLSFDRRDKQKDTLPKIDKSFYDFSNMDLSKVNMGKNLKSSDAQLLTDPIAKVAGVPVASATIPYFDLIRKRAIRKKINFKEQLPGNLKRIFGEHFFLVRLKIPKEKYYHFLEYCNPLGIEELYKGGKHLDILKILLKESKSYLLLLENNK